MTTAQKFELAAINFGMPPMSKNKTTIYDFDGEVQIALKGQSRKFSRFQFSLVPFVKAHPEHDYKYVAIGFNDDGQIFFAFDMPGYEAESMPVDSGKRISSAAKVQQLFQVLGLTVPTEPDASVQFSFTLKPVQVEEGTPHVYQFIANESQIKRLLPKPVPCPIGDERAEQGDLGKPVEIKEARGPLLPKTGYVFYYQGEELEGIYDLMTTEPILDLDSNDTILGKHHLILRVMEKMKPLLGNTKYVAYAHAMSGTLVNGYQYSVVTLLNDDNDDKGLDLVIILP